MTGIFSLGTRDDAAIEERARLNPLDTSQTKASAFQNVGKAIGYGAERFAADIQRTTGLAAGAVAGSVDYVTGNAFGLQERVFDKVAEYDKAAIQHTPNQWEFGTAGQILYGLTKIGGEAVTMGPVGVLVQEYIGGRLDKQAQGVDTITAGKAALAESILTTAGVSIPGIFNTGILQNIGIGATVNTAQGIASRWTVGKILEDNGYADMAKNYQALDGEAILADAVIGGFIAGGGRYLQTKTGSRTLLPSEGVDDIVTAAFIKKQQYHLETSGPGVPTDIQSRQAHYSNITGAIDDLINDRPVSLREPPGEMVPNVARDEAKSKTLQAVRDTIASEGEKTLIDGKQVEIDRPGFGMPEPVKSLPDDHPLLTDTATIDTPERAALRQSIVKEVLSDSPTITDRSPILYLMGGGGGSGKGAVLGALVRGGEVPTKAVHIDPDKIKEKLPEYRQLIDLVDSRAAAVVHAESSALKNQILAFALEGKKDAVLDVTLSDKGKGLKLIQEAKNAGYEVRLFGVSVDPETAIVRANVRAKEGRHVPTDALLKAHKGFSEGFTEYAKLADKTTLYDNNGKTPRAIAASENGNVSIFDEAAYNKFVRKGGLNEQAQTIRSLRESQNQSRATLAPPGHRPEVVRASPEGTAGEGSQGSAGVPGDLAGNGSVTSEHPSIRNSAEIAQTQPDLAVTLENGEVVTAADAVELMRSLDTEAKESATGIRAAVQCFLRGAA